MAIAPLNEFKSKTLNLTDTDQVVLEVPVSVAVIVLDARAINITGEGPSPTPANAYLTVELEKAEGGPAEGAVVVPSMEVPPNDALEFISGKFVMQEGDILRARADDADKLQLLISYLETSA